MSFFFQTVAGLLRGSMNDTSGDERNYRCKDHYCHHQAEELSIRSERRFSLRKQNSVVSATSSIEDTTSFQNTTTD